ncbi:cupin domain-containing protein [Tuwongella immobilis]|uniref:DUF985 domain-containing protein n=1 Tax=Tuwongella immobilis TaxID=692036 RepID=A0A6C2YQH5_9BACT|nr:cupin domain-containing protein [Tuwongella immobilis]VIP03581.1 Uncharacterized protein OS=Desulfovibrio aespoeensis (strain ATCC 700646 / DSM 10631 / Aspo-2) GN=Daes_0336 PE=4 SV=1: Cupin_5 [Tuwongella immobilis]VTS04530.1 Uncharacterized protein OS=Desulfovibrio aespoeensis (strain ATCC 700646 / DSM 10631 / Aspo-2) GN=Daes_0336 PE=4 SV=1: Cupin_5 [Tuwongella immobilis]
MGAPESAEQIIQILGLQQHPMEGGYFVETYRSRESIAGGIYAAHTGPRSVGTAIYYLLTPTSVSVMHQLPTDEIFHFYLGDPIEMLQLFPDGSSCLLEIGTDLAQGQRPQVVVPGGVWQGSILKPGGRFALIGATMAPGFDYSDYVHGQRADLVARYPSVADAIHRRLLEP